MNYLAFALVPKSEAVSSKEAKEVATDILQRDPSFIGTEDVYRFWTPMCDRFYIGGPLSGRLYPKEMLEEFYQQVDSLGIPKTPYSYDLRQIKLHEDEVDKIWHDLGGMDKNPLSRSGRDYDDDARLLTKDLISTIEERETFDCSEEYIYGCEPKLEELIGKAWVVVVGYHN